MPYKAAQTLLTLALAALAFTLAVLALRIAALLALPTIHLG